MRATRLSTHILIILLAVTLAVQHAGPATSVVYSQSQDDLGWEINPSYQVTYLGRDEPSRTDRYEVTASWGATFFDIAVETMPLVPAERGMDTLLEAFTAAYPTRRQGDIRPGDRFEFHVPVGTLVGVEWRSLDGAREFRSFHGDRMIMYTTYDSPLEYRLIRADNPGFAEMKITRVPAPDTLALAKAIYGMDDPDFRPDFLQLVRALRINQDASEMITVDIRRQHLDDLRNLTGNQEPSGASASGLDIYRIHSDEIAQPVFRVDDGIKDSIDFSSVPSIMRVYYYKNGVVRTYQKMEALTLVSDRQPRNAEWASVFADYGKANPTPQRWGVGQPEQDSAASEFHELGIQVLRFTPRDEPATNFLMHLLNAVMEFMKGGLQEIMRS